MVLLRVCAPIITVIIQITARLKRSYSSYFVLYLGNTMANTFLKEICQELHSEIVGINPDSVVDALFSKKVICSDDCQRLHHIPVTKDRCRKLLLLLHESSHPQSFIHLRLALVDLGECWWIVDKIDKKLPSLTSQLQQLHLSQSTEGKFLFRTYK